MRFLYNLIISTAAMAVASAINPATAIEADLNEVEGSEAIFERADNGLGRIELTFDGAYQGVLVETAEGSVRAYDASGKEIDLNAAEPEDDAVANTVAKISGRHHHKHKHHHGLLHKIGRTLKKFEKKAWSFFKCAGSHVLTKCGVDFATCAEHGQTPAQCQTGLACGGKEVIKCL